MSLAVLADHMASKGRGPDSMLIHMSPREVQGLQALAEHHGGSLTINPETGLPEAGFLDKLLPTIIGAGLTFFGGVPPNVAAAIVGGIQTVRTGDIGKGISAGLGAYGGANLTAGLTEAGASTIGAAEAAKGLTMSPELLAEFGGDSAKDALLQQQVTDRMAAATPYEKLSSGFDAFKNNPMGMAKSLAMPAAMAFGPAILAEANVKNNMPQTVTKPGMIAPYSYFGGQYVAGNPFQATPTRAAGGGLMSMNNGGYDPGQLDFTQKSEPVVRMAGGGVAHLAAGGDAALAAYQAGDYATANRLLGEAGMSAQDVVSKYNLDAAQAADVARNLGYAGDMSGIQYGSGYVEPVAETVAYTSPVADRTVVNRAAIEPDYFEQQFAPDVFAPVDTSPVSTPTASAASYTPNRTAIEPEDTYVAPAGIEALAATLPIAAPVAAPVTTSITSAPVVTAPETSSGLAALSTTPTYNKYTNEEIAKYLVTNPTVDIAKAIKETNADPAAVNAYIASIADPFRGSTDTTGGSGVLGIYNQMKAQGIDPNELYKAEIANDPKYAGYTQPMIQRSYDLSKGAYALTDQIAKDKIAADPKLGYDKQWVKYMEDNKYTVDEMAQAFGISKNEIRDRIQKVKAAEAVVTPPIVPPVVVPPINATQNTTTTVAQPTDLYTAPASSLPVGVSGNTGPSQIGGGATVNPNGTITTSPRIPGIPVGGFTGMTNLRDTYEDGGGSLGVNKNIFVPKTYKELEDRFKLTGGSKQAMDYLTGKTKYNPVPYTEDGQIAKSYAESVMKIPVASSSKMYVFKNGKYEVNPEYAIPTYDKDGKKSLNLTNADVKTFMDKKPSTDVFYTWATTNNLSPEQIALASGRPINEISKLFTGAKDLVDEEGKIDQTKLDEKTAADEKTNFDYVAYLKANPDVQAELDAGKANFGTKDDLAAAAYEHYLRYGKAGGRAYTKKAAGGGLMNMAMARGGMSQQFDLGGYSDGGRLLRGPGDGVSDSIPATIGNKRPARLADGEFVVPARIVSELGNGSTEAGARKLYAMMDRVQSARRGTVGKGRVAKNSRSEKYLPA